MEISRKITCLWLVSLVISSCLGDCSGDEKQVTSMGAEKISIQEKYGIAYNPERAKLGIPLLEEGWTFNEKECWWENCNHIEGKPGHIKKRIVVKNRVLVRESDMYVSGRTYEFIDPDMPKRPSRLPETLLITYFYRDPPKSLKSSFDFTHSGEADDFGMNPTLDDARKLLKKWGLELK